MRVLGVVLAGGASSRFGSDKALALLAGRPLIEHVLGALLAQTDGVAVSGRAYGRFRGLQDRPKAGLGPLGGLCAALFHAEACGFDAVLSASCDTPDLPSDLAVRLSPAAPAIVRDNPVLGCWPVGLATRLEQHLASSDDRSMRAWARLAGASAVDLPAPITNVNRPADLDRLRQQETC